MATGGGESSVTNTSEEIFDFECFNCSEKGQHVEAEVFCVECGDNLCRSCLDVHNQISRLRKHQIKDKSSLQPGTTQNALPPPSEKCAQHDGRIIDRFCGDHDDVGCSVCVSEKHRSCTNVSYIQKVAGGISASKELQDAQTTANMLKSQLYTLKTSMEKDLEHIQTQRDEELERAELFKEKIIKRIGELGMKTEMEIQEHYRQLEDGINKDLDELSEMVESLENTIQQLSQSMKNETKLFVHVKECKRHISAGQNLANTQEASVELDKGLFCNNDAIETYLNNLKSLCLLDDAGYSAIHLSDQNVRSSTDTQTCRITGVCRLDTGEYVIADNNNDCIKKLDTAFNIESRLPLPSKPWDVCQINATELAVTMALSKKIQFVSVGQTLSLARSFDIPGNSVIIGIAFRQGKLYVGRDFVCVQVYNTNGTLLQTIQNDKAGTRMIYAPVHMTPSACSSRLYITDYYKGVVVLDKSDQFVSTIASQELTNEYGICVVSEDQLLVCGRASHNIIQFDDKGSKIKTLLTETDGLRYPELLYFDSRKHQLVVGMLNSDNIKVFQLRRK